MNYYSDYNYLKKRYAKKYGIRIKHQVVSIENLQDGWFGSLGTRGKHLF